MEDGLKDGEQKQTYSGGLLNGDVNIYGPPIGSKKKSYLNLKINYEEGIINNLVYYNKYGELRNGLYSELIKYEYKDYLVMSNYKDGVKEGEEKIYKYFHGQDISKKIYLKIEKHYKNGKLDGDVLIYQYQGGVAIKAQFKEGIQTGKETWYLYDGEKYAEFNYKNNKRHGTAVVYKRRLPKVYYNKPDILLNPLYRKGFKNLYLFDIEHCGKIQKLPTKYYIMSMD